MSPDRDQQVRGLASGPRRQTGGPARSELRAQQRMARAGQYLRICRNQPVIVSDGPPQRLVKQQVAVVVPVSQVVDHHHMPREPARRPFPASGDRIVIDHHQVGPQTLQDPAAFGGIVLQGHA